MQISSDFSIETSPSHAFDIFLDPQVMQRCIPGCAELERVDELHYRGKLTNEIAHVKFNANFTAEIVEMDRPRKIRAALSGEDRRLGSSIKVTIALELEQKGEGCRVAYQMDFAIWGKLGRLGEPIVRRRSAEVERDFVAALILACNASDQEESAQSAHHGSGLTAAGTVISVQSPPGASEVRRKRFASDWVKRILVMLRWSK